MRVRFCADLWRYDEQGGWHFVTVPEDVSDDVRDAAGLRGPGFGSVRVRATVGATTWATSVFPSRGGSYVLPVKQDVRRREGLEAGDRLEVALELVS